MTNYEIYLQRIASRANIDGEFFIGSDIAILLDKRAYSAYTVTVTQGGTAIEYKNFDDRAKARRWFRQRAKELDFYNRGFNQLPLEA